jgi:hypothetical protein
MSKISKYTDVAIICLIGYLIAVAIFQHFTQNITLSLNFYIGVAAWLFTVWFKTSKNDAKYAVFILLLCAVFNIILFTASVSSFGRVYYLYKGDNLNIASLGLNPFILLIFLLYFSVNRKVGLELYTNVFYGSDKEAELKTNKEIEFYYIKFNDSTYEELVKFYKNYKSYPLSAQVALKKIHEERELSIMNF